MMRLIFLVIALAGCASPASVSDSRIAEGTTDQMKACTFLQSLSASSPFYGIFAARAIRSAKTSLYAQAAELGATHLVFGQAETTKGSTTQHATAYRCPR